MNETNKDKFLIIAFPVNKVVQDNDEARNIIKISDLKSSRNQEIYLEAEFDTAQFDSRGTMQHKPTTSINSEETSINYLEKEKCINTNPSEMSETRKQIDEIKRDIQNYEKENEKLNHLLNNYATNSILYKSKVKSKLCDNVRYTR